MPYTIAQLLTNLGTPVTADPDEPIQRALERMLQYKYSQLPVMDRTDRKNPFYLITSDSILIALSTFGMTTEAKGLRVREAMIPVAQAYRPDDDLWKLLEGMTNTNAALVLDEEGNLKHVVTSFDTTQFFRQWSEDMMYARDVEDLIKDYITEAFKRGDGTIDEEARSKAIEELTSSNSDLKKKFKKAIERYLKNQAANGVRINRELAEKAFAELLSWREEDKLFDGDQEVEKAANSAAKLQRAFERALGVYLQGQANAEVKPVAACMEDAFLEIYNKHEQVKPFKDLTLGTFIELFFRTECWGRIQDVFGLDETSVRFLLKSVNDTRNKLAHFREDEISTSMREQLKSCANWLNKHRHEAKTAFQGSPKNSDPAPIVEAAVQIILEEPHEMGNPLGIVALPKDQST